MVKYADGEPVAEVQIDLFRNVEGQRDGFLGAVRTDAAGEYEFVSPAGPHILTFIAPNGDAFVAGNRYYQSNVSVDAGETASGVNATLLGSTAPNSGTLGGMVTDSEGSPVAGVKIDLFAMQSDGARGRFLRSIRTDEAGSYRMATPAGCYVLTMIAPEGQLFDSGRQWHQPTVCIEAGEARSDIDAKLRALGAGV